MHTITIIGLTGEPGAGKDVVADYLVTKHGAVKYTMSVVLKSILDCLYLSNTRKNLVDLAVALRTKFGNAILADVLKKSILNDNPKLAVISGIRYKEEFQVLKNLNTEKIIIENESFQVKFKLWYITTDLEIRYNRLKMRHEKLGEADMSWDKFIHENQMETEIWIKNIAKNADITIKNNAILQALYQQIEESI